MIPIGDYLWLFEEDTLIEMYKDCERVACSQVNSKEAIDKAKAMIAAIIAELDSRDKRRHDNY